MPIYTYKCDYCGHCIEKNVPIERRDKFYVHCPKEGCGGGCFRTIDKPRGVYAPTSGKGLA